MRINIIVARSANGVIGRDGDLPWRLSADLQRFKAVTMGHPLIMGRKTHASIGRPLPGRRNIVVSRQADYRAAGCTVVDSFDAAVAAAQPAEEIMVIGGASLYTEALDSATRLYVTEVHTDITGDTFFPGLDPEQWTEVSRERYPGGNNNDHDYSFVVLDRVGESSSP